MILVIHVSANRVVAGAAWKKKKGKENEKKGEKKSTRDVTSNLVPVAPTGIKYWRF